MIVRAVLCPSPPLLASGVSGQAAVLPELRDACEAAVAWLLAAAPDEVTVVGPAAVTAAWPLDSAADLLIHAPAVRRRAGLDAVAGPDVDPADATSATALPLSLTVGAQLLDAADYAGPRVLQSIAESASPDACADLGRDLAADAPLTALLVMGDGTARRSAAAPGYLDERAEPFDTVVEQAFRDGDLASLAALDPDLARDLLAAGRPAWQVLAAALSAPATGLQSGPTPQSAPASESAFTWNRPRTRVLYSDAPFGVAYLVTTLEPTL